MADTTKIIIGILLAGGTGIYLFYILKSYKIETFI